MVPFRNAQESHNHSKEILDVLYGYDSFLDSLEIIADFGCGSGLDAKWWATLKTRDDPPEPRNYTVYAVDKDLTKVDSLCASLSNVFTFEADIENVTLPRTVDFIWCHDAFQYVVNPIQTLAKWNSYMNVNGMLLISIPQATHYSYNRLQAHSYNYCYYNHNIVSLMYMLAVNGFDCRDAYFLKKENDTWLHAAVYKSDIAPMDPTKTSWYNLADLNLLNDSVLDCINKFGYVKQDEILVNWLDKDFHLPKE